MTTARTPIALAILLVSGGGCPGSPSERSPAPVDRRPASHPADVEATRPGATASAATLPSFATRDPRAPTTGAWLPNAWYCRLPKAPDPLDQATSDEAWERRALDIFSWDAFIAIQWPQRFDGSAWLPADTLEPKGEGWVPRWGSWFNDVDIPSLSRDAAFLRDSDRGWPCQGTCLTTELAGARYAPGDNGLWDRNGALVRFETRVNDAWLGALKTPGSRLSFQTGQCATDYPRMLCNGDACERCGSPPLRSCANAKPGERVIGDTFDIESAIEIKLAWRVLDPARDDYDRFVTVRGVALETSNVADLGLIAMHLLQKPKTHPGWTWSSFEHVDNLEEHGGQRSSFRAGECPNTIPPAGRVRHTHLTRTTPMAESTATLNREVRALLANERSPLAYYELVGTQYGRYGHTRTPPVPVENSIPLCTHESDVAKSVVIPEELRNTIIEPYLVPATDACPNPIEPKHSSCIECHSAAPSCDFSFIEERFGPQVSPSLEHGASKP